MTEAERGALRAQVKLWRAEVEGSGDWALGERAAFDAVLKLLDAGKAEPEQSGAHNAGIEDATRSQAPDSPSDARERLFTSQVEADVAAVTERVDRLEGAVSIATEAIACLQRLALDGAVVDVPGRAAPSGDTAQDHGDGLPVSPNSAQRAGMRQQGDAPPSPPAPTPEPSPAARPSEPFICDVRSGIVAVYRGPERNCLAHIGDDPTVVFSRTGYKIEKPHVHWQLRDEDVATAHTVCEALNDALPAIESAAFERGARELAAELTRRKFENVVRQMGPPFIERAAPSGDTAQDHGGTEAGNGSTERETRERTPTAPEGAASVQLSPAPTPEPSPAAWPSEAALNAAHRVIGFMTAKTTNAVRIAYAVDLPAIQSAAFERGVRAITEAIRTGELEVDLLKETWPEVADRFLAERRKGG